MPSRPANRPSNVTALNASPRVLSWVAAMAEALSLPLLLVDRSGALLNANMAGMRELARGGMLKRDGELVVPAQDGQREAFAALLAHTAQTRERGLWDDDAGAAHEPIVVAPVAAERSAPTALVMLVLPAEAAMAESCRLFAYQYGLSPAELSVLLALCQGHAPPEIAQMRGVTPSTVRKQLARVQRKCGERSIDTLLPRLGGLPPVLALARRAGE